MDKELQFQESYFFNENTNFIDEDSIEIDDYSYDCDYDYTGDMD